jgi:hypothetical protein
VAFWAGVVVVAMLAAAGAAVISFHEPVSVETWFER